MSLATTTLAWAGRAKIPARRGSLLALCGRARRWRSRPSTAPHSSAPEPKSPPASSTHGPRGTVKSGSYCGVPRGECDETDGPKPVTFSELSGYGGGRTGSGRRSGTGRRRRRTTRGTSSRRRSPMSSRTRSRRPTLGRTCSSGGGSSWTIGLPTLTPSANQARRGDVRWGADLG